MSNSPFCSKLRGEDSGGYEILRLVFSETWTGSFNDPLFLLRSGRKMHTTKEALMRAMEAYFDGDTKRINHADRVAAYAEQILKREGADYPIVIGASVLHDIGIHQAEKKYGSTSGKYQEKEGPPIARQILAGLGFEQSQVEEICEIIAHHHSPGKINTRNFKILYDAD